MVKLALVRTGVWPLDAAYRAVYRAAAQLAVAALRARFPGCVSSAYLRRSAAMGSVVPGLSDVDLFFVLADATVPDDHAAIGRFYARLARRIPLLDGHLEAFPWQSIVRLQRDNPAFRFRFLEQPQTWRRLFGPDAMARLEPPSPAETTVAHVFAVKSWVTLWNAFCLDHRGDAFANRRREYFLYKLLGALLVGAGHAAGRAAVYRRDVLCRSFAEGHISLDGLIEPGEAERLRRFAEHTLRLRLRRTFAADEAARWPLAISLLLGALRLLGRLYALHGAASSDMLRDEHVHFYRDGVFLPRQRLVAPLDALALADRASLLAAIARDAARGVDTGLYAEGFLVDLASTDPSIGHCTVVAAPNDDPCAAARPDARAGSDTGSACDPASSSRSGSAPTSASGALPGAAVGVPGGTARGQGTRCSSQ